MNETRNYIDVLDALEIVARNIPDIGADAEGELFCQLMDKAISFVADDKKGGENERP